MKNNSEDAETPRTLLSSMLQHVKPVETVRRPTRRSSTANSKLRKSNKTTLHTNQTTKASRVSIDSSKSAKKNNSKESESTPRVLIADALKQQAVQKTLRVALRQTHPTILVQLDKKEKDDSNTSLTKVPVVDSPDTKLDVTKTPVSSSKSTNRSFQSSTQSPIVESSKTKSDIAKTPVSVTKTAYRSFQRSSNNDDIDNTILLHHKPREKRMRLSEINLSKIVDNAEETSFTNDLAAKVQALINKNKENVTIQKSVSKHKSTSEKRQSKNSPLLSSTRITSFFEPSRKDAMTNTFSMNESIIPANSTRFKTEGTQIDTTLFSQQNTVIEKDKEEASFIPADEIINPSSLSDPGSDVEGPLGLSGLFNETDKDREKASHASQSNISRKSPIHSSQDIDNTSYSEENVVLKSQNFSANRRSSTVGHVLNNIDVAENHTMEKSSTPVKVHKTTHQSDLDGAEVQDNNMDAMEAAPAQHKVPPSKLPIHKKIVRKIKPPYRLPFPRSQLQGIVQHYSTLKISKEAFSEIEEISRHYFAQTVNNLEQICHSRKRKTITSEDIVKLMKRRKHLTKKKTLNFLIEENLPLDHREELIEVAIAGNKTLP